MSILLAIVIAAAAFGIGYAIGSARRKDAAPVAAAQSAPLAAAPASPAAAALPPAPAPMDGILAERARIVRSLESEAAMLRRGLASRDAAITHLEDLAVERRELFDDLATARADTARYRQLIVDLEDNAPPPIFGPGAPDDLKLIVGVGPILERMLHQLGIATYRQIARWSERDIDEVDAKLAEFPGRIRRDAWVTQARELHQSKYGEAPSVRGR